MCQKVWYHTPREGLEPSTTGLKIDNELSSDRVATVELADNPVWLRSNQLSYRGFLRVLPEIEPDFFKMFKAGAFKVEDGRLVGVTLDGERLPVDSRNPKVWLAAGNCLLGDIDGIDSMALAFLDSASATQFVGYSGRTWHGRAGWGTADWFLSDPGRWNLSEAVFFNQIQLIDELREIDPALTTLDLGDFAPREDPIFGEKLRETWGRGVDEPVFQRALGHLWDRDVLVFYGDPSWDARLAQERPLWTSACVLA